jgi:hypothetical protein
VALKERGCAKEFVGLLEGTAGLRSPPLDHHNVQKRGFIAKDAMGKEREYTLGWLIGKDGL